MSIWVVNLTLAVVFGEIPAVLAEAVDVTVDTAHDFTVALMTLTAALVTEPVPWAMVAAGRSGHGGSSGGSGNVGGAASAAVGGDCGQHPCGNNSK